MNKKFSVLMSVYCKEKPDYLDKALNSVFNQSIIPSEVVLIEDGKLNADLDLIIEKYKKEYNEIFKVVKFDKNRGLGIALHDGLMYCSNELIFRMDTDDICLPDRFEKQLKIFDEKDVDVVGSNIIEYDESMKLETSRRLVPQSDFEIKRMLKKRNPLNHMTVAYKKSKVIEAGNYQNMMYFEDYYLWARMSKIGCKFYNSQDFLVNVRGGNDMIKRRGGKKYIKPIIRFEKELLKLKTINIAEYYKNIFVRMIGALIPNSFRFILYKKVLRK